MPRVSLVAVANDGGEKQVQKYNNWKMNHVLGANVVILKQPTVEETENDYNSCTYLVIITT